MKSYIGVKIIKAQPMSEHEFAKQADRPVAISEKDRPGYLVKYSDNYESWSPKEQFELAYREITGNEKNMI